MAYYCQLKSIRRLRFHGFLASSRFEKHSAGVKEGKIISNEFAEPKGFRFLGMIFEICHYID